MQTPFPSAPTAPPLSGLILDFDGTVTRDDIGDLICGRFAPPRWREIADRWARGDLSLSEAQRQMWALCRCTLADAVAYAHEVGVLRPGLDRLLTAAAAAGVPVTLASGGFDFYIEPLLGQARLNSLSSRFYNRARFHGEIVKIEFPHGDLSCARCAICKGRVCQNVRVAVAGPIAFVGDGFSDRCILDHVGQKVDAIFAVRGSDLDRLLLAEGAPAQRFDDLHEVAAALFGVG